ncbi:MAG: C25 family cysteine peptidase [Candidatus Lernaella stagnicola]|nr:C25 family cysteine peptidase [Candidatus Lernaella stagnicola]
MKKVFVAFLLIAALAWPAFAEEIELTYDFDDPTWISGLENTVEPRLAGLRQQVIPGEPVVPVATAWVAIPQGHEVVSVVVDENKTQQVFAGRAAWGSKFAPLSRPTFAQARPSAAIYGGATPYPAARHRTLTLQYKRGVAIQPVALYPVQYLPNREAFAFAGSLVVRVKTRPATKPAAVMPYRGLPADLRELRARVDNPAIVDSYHPDAAGKGEPLDYLAIAPESFHGHLETYLAHKTELFGLRCEVASYEQILAETPGANEPAKVRNYIRQRYDDGLQWVLLVGDADRDSEVLPLRPLYVTGVDPDDGSTFTDPTMATDQYYGCLDGSYNGDGDWHWGETTDGDEGGDVDLLFDVHVGRFAVDEPWELSMIGGKTMAFENDDATPWRVLFVGEYADSQTWGGDNKDEVFTHCGDQTIPITKLYDRDGTNTHRRVIGAINSDAHQWLNHLGHADVTSNMGFYPSEVASLENERPYLGFSQGCYSGSVDGVQSYGGHSWEDCMAEQFTNQRRTGAFAYFMNTRYGFYLTGRNDGPSNVYDWELAEAFFVDGVPNIGAAMDKGKEDCIGLLSPNTMMRWAWYTLLLFGDPQTPMRLNCDNDGDGVDWTYCGGEDCDDQNEAILPGAEEICDDGLDNNCDGLTDEEDPACAAADDDSAIDDDTSDDDAIDDDDATDDDAIDDDDATDDDTIDDDVTDDDAADDDDNDDSGGCN